MYIAFLAKFLWHICSKWRTIEWFCWDMVQIFGNYYLLHCVPLIEQTISIAKRIMYNWLNSYELLVIEDHKCYWKGKRIGWEWIYIPSHILFLSFLYKSCAYNLLEFDNHRLPLLITNSKCRMFFKKSLLSFFLL